MPCGIDVDLYSMDEKNVLHTDRSIVVGKVEPRKRQSFLQGENLNIDFIGNNVDPSFDTNDLVILVNNLSKISWTILHHMRTWCC